MYITKYWGDFIGGSDDSLSLAEFLEDPKSYDLYEMIGDDIIEMAEIVKKLRKELLQYEA